MTQRDQSRSRSFVICIAVALCAIAFSIATSGGIEYALDKELPTWSRDKAVLITGANAGLGLATALRIARAGTANTIILACRNPSKCQVAMQDAVSILPEGATTRVLTVELDLSKRDSVMKGAHAIQEALSDQETADQDVVPDLDVLINNAGVAFAWNSKEFVEGVETHMAINHLSHFLLTHRLLPNLLAAAGKRTGANMSPPRVVHVSSLTAIGSWRDVSLGWKNPNPRKAMGRWFNFFDCIRYYSQSKRANLMQTWELHKRYEGAGIISVAAHPGYTRSEIFRKVQMPLSSGWIKELATKNPYLSMSTDDGATMQLMAAFAPPDIVPSGSHVVPKYWTTGTPVLIPRLLSGFSLHYNSFSEKDTANLWDASMKELGIEEFGKLESGMA
ncbi:unnamed protein product [Cylindrotheca closterium]|uniref:Protochlorophyllide reductase n=1 Tax=Cylindrotheca closterium TaxID=2856 RepID=A0AAD2G070_9STRA|nr:unnamed protein product [Cylindrotheca closterium]